MFKKNLTIMLLATSLISINIYSDTTPTIQEDEKYDETKFPEEGIPIKLLVPLKTEQKSPEEEENIAGPPVEQPLEQTKSNEIKPQKTRFFNKNYKMQDLYNLLGQANEINITKKTSAQKKLSALQNKHDLLEKFLRSLTTEKTLDFAPIEGVKDVANLYKDIKSLKLKDPSVQLKIDLIKARIELIKGILDTLQKTINLKLNQINKDEVSADLINLQEIESRPTSIEEAAPMELLKPTKIEEEKEEIKINLLLPLKAREEGTPKDTELEKRDLSIQYEQFKTPTKMSLLPAKNYSMEMLGDILREVFQINLDDPAEQAKMKNIKKLFEQLNMFLEKVKAKIQQRDFGKPISVYGILDVANISKYLSQIDPNSPTVVLESDLEFIRYKLNNLERFLEELKRLITKKEDGTKSAKVALFPYPSFFTKSIKSDEKLTQETANELTRRIKGLATTIKEENIDYARKMLVRFLGNYGLIIWAPEGSDMESVQFALYKPEKVDPKFTENYINTLDKKALKEYMILLIDQLTKNKPELFEELIKFKEDLK